MPGTLTVHRLGPGRISQVVRRWCRRREWDDRSVKPLRNDSAGSGRARRQSWPKWESALWSFDATARHAAHLAAAERFVAAEENHNARDAAGKAARRLVEFPDSILERIDEFSPEVARGLASNRRSPERLLWCLYRLYLDRQQAGEGWQWLGVGEINLARNPNTPVSILRELYEYGVAAGGFGHDAVVSLAYNPATPADIIEAISVADLHPVVGGALARRLEPGSSDGTDPPHFGCDEPGCAPCVINSALEEAAGADSRLAALDVPVRFFPSPSRVPFRSFRHGAWVDWRGGPTVSQIIEVVRTVCPNASLSWDGMGGVHLGEAGYWKMRLARTVDDARLRHAYAQSVLTSFASGFAGRRVFDPYWPHSALRLVADSDADSPTDAETLLLELIEGDLGDRPRAVLGWEQAHALLHEDLAGLVEAVRTSLPDEWPAPMAVGPAWPCPACDTQPVYAVYDFGSAPPVRRPAGPALEPRGGDLLLGARL